MLRHQEVAPFLRIRRCRLVGVSHWGLCQPQALSLIDQGVVLSSNSWACLQSAMIPAKVIMNYTLKRKHGPNSMLSFLTALLVMVFPPHP